MADSETEMTLCQIQLCHVFKIPPRKSASGHLAKEWTEDVWQGRLRVIQKGRTCTIFLVDKDSGELFAKCPVKEGAVERAADSSRYFVLKIENAAGKNACACAERARGGGAAH